MTGYSPIDRRRAPFRTRRRALAPRRGPLCSTTPLFGQCDAAVFPRHETMSAPAVFPNGDYVASSTRHCHEPLPPMLTLRAARRPSPYRRRKHARQDSARRGRGARMRVRIVPAAVDARADARFPRRIRRACAVLVTVPTFRIANGRPRVAAPHARRSSCRKRIIRALCLRFYFNTHIEIRSTKIFGQSGGMRNIT